MKIKHRMEERKESNGKGKEIKLNKPKDKEFNQPHITERWQEEEEDGAPKIIPNNHNFMPSPVILGKRNKIN